jgi:hypothetical protein
VFLLLLDVKLFVTRQDNDNASKDTFYLLNQNNISKQFWPKNRGLKIEK